MLPSSFYQKTDVIYLAKKLLGKAIYTNINNELTAGIIVETESYRGVNDKASHAYNNKRTKKNEAMYLEGGNIYVYICYGIHHLLNVVTNKKDIPHAILIRAIEPTIGIDVMLKRRNKKKENYSLTAGPGSLTQALGISILHNMKSLNDKEIWIEDVNNEIEEYNIIKSPRVGVSYAKEDALLPWRFRIKDNPWTSKAI
jgi:DNA-3-methyladenine glycosylase